MEQGGVPEGQKSPIGAVTGIAAPASLRITVEDRGGHADAVLIKGRRDSLLGAA